MSNEAHVETSARAREVAVVENTTEAAAKDVISSIFGSAACVYTGQVSH